jgi:hypothetical protein
MPGLIVADGAQNVQPSTDRDTRSTVLAGPSAELVALLWQPRFPTVEEVERAAALLPRVRDAARQQWLTEGPRPFVRVGPGVIEVRSKDFARAERAAEREVHRHEVDVDMLAQYVGEHGEFPEDPDPTRVISEWSSKSRANMMNMLSLLDFNPMYSNPTRVPGMVTLTYPLCWLSVAPTGREVKKHMKAFRKRYERAWGEPLRCVWKLEFQQRLVRDENRNLVRDENGDPIPLACPCDVCTELGDDGHAPHIHMLMVPPHGTVDGMQFRQWASWAWADVVAHPVPEQYANHLRAGTRVDINEGLRASDPRRTAVYFLKHAQFQAKEYQHTVPQAWQQPGDGPGRFWGYWGLHKASAVVELDQDVAVVAGRTLRRYAAAQSVTRQVRRPRVPRGRILATEDYEVIGLAGAYLVESRRALKFRKTRTPARRLKGNRGFLLVNDGPAMATQLARYLNQRFPQAVNLPGPAGETPVQDHVPSESVNTDVLNYAGEVRSATGTQECTVCREPLDPILARDGLHLLCRRPGRF